jgi:hypothetical protein
MLESSSQISHPFIGGYITEVTEHEKQSALAAVRCCSAASPLVPTISLHAAHSVGQEYEIDENLQASITMHYSGTRTADSTSLLLIPVNL